MRPYTIARKTQFETVDKDTHFTIWVEAPEDITSRGLQHTKLDFIIDNVSAFIHDYSIRTNGLREAFKITDERDRKIIYFSVISVDDSLSQPEKDQLAREMLKALLDEAKIRGAYGVFSPRGAMTKALALEYGFEPASGVWVKILKKPSTATKTATNPPEPLITSFDSCSEYVELMHESDLFADAKEHEFIGIAFGPMQSMVAWATKSKVLTQFENLKQDDSYGFITRVGRDLLPKESTSIPLINPIFSALIESAKRECIDHGAKALIAFPGSKKLADFFDKHGLKNTEIRDNHWNRICIMMLDQATNPPKINAREIAQNLRRKQRRCSRCGEWRDELFLIPSALAEQYDVSPNDICGHRVGVCVKCDRDRKLGDWIEEKKAEWCKDGPAE